MLFSYTRCTIIRQVHGSVNGVKRGKQLYFVSLVSKHDLRARINFNHPFEIAPLYVEKFVI